ncbi:MAG: gamma-glutamyltransferase [Acidimicrobiales bacterium]|nr:gamma-glutamyltransferase [Acidimicrobiales bacterium]
MTGNGSADQPGPGEVGGMVASGSGAVGTVASGVVAGGTVAAGHSAAADAAARILELGGNAFDAVLAAGFASVVCEPGFTSLGGGGFLLARSVEHGDTLFDFFVDTPGRGLNGDVLEPVFEEVVVNFAAADQVFHCGPGSVAVPGILAGYLHVHSRLATLPLREILAPAIELATSGVAVSPTQAVDFQLLSPILARTEASRSIFFPTGTLLAEGDILHNPDLGAFLDQLGGASPETFYRGEMARRFVEQIRSGGGLITLEDLARYRVIERKPLAVPYRGRTLMTNPPPTFGGALLGLALRRVQETVGGSDELGPTGPANRAAVADMTDPVARAAVLGAAMQSVDRDRAGGHPDVLAALAGDLGDDPLARPVATRGTTHVTVTDSFGNVASMTTSNGECSGDVISGTGITCNNMLGEDDLHPDGFHAAPAGERVASMMSPSIVVGASGDALLALGSGGSKRIRSALLQVLVAVLDGGVGLQDAVDAPRFHWNEDRFEVEPGLSEDVLDALGQVGPVNEWPSKSMYFGGVHAIGLGQGEVGQGGAGDARRGGAVRHVPRRG